MLRGLAGEGGDGRHGRGDTDTPRECGTKDKSLRDSQTSAKRDEAK